MRFTLPQFIEHEPKIVGPFTWKQIIYLGSAGTVSFVLYLTIPFQYFILITIFLMLGALSLALLKIGGRPLPVILVNFLKFKISPKIYLWGKKEVPIKVFKKEEEKEEETEEIKEEPLLKITEKSQLKKITSKIEIWTR